MITKVINGKQCTLREVIYSDFGAETPTEKLVEKIKSSDEFKTKEERSELFQDRLYSWTKEDNPYDYKDEDEDKTYSDSDSDSEAEERNYSAGQLPVRLKELKKPLHIQLKNLFREHNRFYKSKRKTLKQSDIDLLIEDFRYELHRVIAKAKTEVSLNGGNMATVIKINSIASDGASMSKSLRELNILFKRIEKTYDTVGHITPSLQTKLNDSLSILISSLILEVYGPELERRKLEASGLQKED